MPNSLNKYAFFEHIKSTKNFDALVDILHDLENRISELDDEQLVKELEKKFDKTIKEIRENVPDLNNFLKSVKGKDGDKGESPTKKELLEIIEPLIPNPIPGKPGEKGKDADETKIIKEVIKQIPIPKDGYTPIKDKDYFDGLNGADGSPDTPEMIVSKLESLEDEDKLKIDAIKDLKEELEKLRKEVGRKTIMGGAGPTGGHVVKAHDLSASLDGSTKTFSLPAFWRVISVHLSSFPNILRPTTDYTTDASLMQITFTSEIDAPTSLATGQTCVIIFSE